MILLPARIFFKERYEDSSSPNKKSHVLAQTRVKTVISQVDANLRGTP